jgi:hypothetical protein
MNWLAVVVAAGLGAGLGYVVCYFGTWIRVHRQESNIRALVNSIDVMRGAGDEVPSEWVQDQLESMLRQEFG